MKSFSERIERFLRAVFPSRVSFEDGSYLEYLNREALRYWEKKGYEIEIMWFFDPTLIRGRILSRASIDCWNPPHDHELISNYKRTEIEEKIITYCQHRRIPLKITND